MKIDKNQLVKVIDFWQKNISTAKLYNRDILNKIALNSKEIIDLTGVRRSGKSSIFKLIIQQLNLKNNFLYINFEDPFFIAYNDPNIIDEIIAIFKEYFNSKLDYLFFDEIQEIEYWEKAVRKLRDAENYKIFITGSSSKLLSGEIASLITGRHISYNIYPLNFEEFLNFNNLEINTKKDVLLKDKKILKLFDEYIKIGGFPEAVLTKSYELLKNYFYDILQKDIVMRYNIREKDILEKMAVYILSNSGKIISVETLKTLFNISFNLVSSYLTYFKEAFLIFEVSQFSYSLKKQHKALKKMFSIDTGLSNAVSFKFSEDKGRALENIVFLELKNRGLDIYYYKTKNNLEVDFFITEKTKPKQIIQVSWTLEYKKTKDREIKALLNAMSEINLNEGLIITYNEEDFIEINNKTITIKPFYKWINDKYF